MNLKNIHTYLIFFALNFLFLEGISQKTKLIIITHDKFYNEVRELADWRTRKGIQTLLVRTTTMQTDPTNLDIRNFIWAVNDTAMEAFDHILLVGDHSLLPPFFGVNNSLTDHPYSLSDTLDYLPDYSVGRLSVFTAEECETLIEKIINHEQNLYQVQDDWYRSALVAASDINLDHDHGAHLKNFFYQNEYDTVYDLRARNQNLISHYVTGAVDSGVAWIFYIGIGNSNAWNITGGYTNYDVEKRINNLNMPPVVISVGCSNADIDYPSDDCFGESWTKSHADKGAIAFISATEITPFFLSDTLGKHTLFSYFDPNVRTLGEALAKGKEAVYQAFKDSTPDAEIEKVVQQFILLGDPTLQPWTRKPLYPVMTFPEVVEPGNISLTVQVKVNDTAFPGVNICLTDQVFDIQLTGITNANGEITFDYDYTPVDPGYMYLVASGKNVVSVLDSFLVSDEDGLPEKRYGSNIHYLAAHEKISISTSREMEQVWVIDISGKKFYHEQTGSNHFSLSVNRFPKGAYIIRIQYPGGFIENKKVVIY